MVQFIKKYRHGLIILAYAIVYMLFFEYLECRPVWGFHVIDTVFDDYIPFCEYFIVPYLLWFPYQILTVLYFIFRNKNKKEYYQLIFNMMMGMTVFLIVSYGISKCTALKTIRVSKGKRVYRYGKMAVSDGYTDQCSAKYSCI